MYYIVFVLSISIYMPDGQSAYKEILVTSKLEHCIYEAKQYANLLSKPDYQRHIEEFKIQCKKVGRHDV